MSRPSVSSDVQRRNWPKLILKKSIDNQKRSLRNKALGLVLSAIPRDVKQKLAINLGVPHIYWSLSQLKRFGFAPNSVVDVGAYQGDWAKTCLRIFPKARITCVEPQQASLLYLEALAEQHPNINVMQCLLGPSCHENVPFDETGSGSSALLRSQTKNTRPMRTLDQLIDEGFCQPPELLKLDVQGYEIEVLEGFTKHFSTCKVIQCELSLLPLVEGAPLLDAAIAYLNQRGFALFDVDELIRSPSDGAVWQIDALFCRTDSPLRNQRQWST
jgi:FkbM family methyltransferase